MWPQGYNPLHSILLSALISCHNQSPCCSGLSVFAAFWVAGQAQLSMQHQPNNRVAS